MQDLFWCDATDEQGGLLHAPDCNQHECFVVQGKKQDTNTRGKAKMPDHYRCTVTCASCGKCQHYEDVSTPNSACWPSWRTRPRVPVEVPEARAMARKARVSLKDEAKLKVKRKATLEDAEALT